VDVSSFVGESPRSNAELEQLGDAVAHTDRMCFAKEANLSVVRQLQTIEAELE
jgi:hypothetical protein